MFHAVRRAAGRAGSASSHRFEQVAEVLLRGGHVDREAERLCRIDVLAAVVDEERLGGFQTARGDHFPENRLGGLQLVHPVGEVNGVEIVLHVVPVGREHAPDELHRGRVVVREHVGPDTPAAERLDLAEFRDGDRHQKLPVGPRDPFVRDVGRTREAAHLLARLVEGDVAVFEAADHLGGVVGVDEFRHGVHAERAERRDAAIQVEVHEDAPEVEYYVFDLFHGFRSRSGRVRRHKDTKFCVPALRSFSADGILPAQDAFFRRGRMRKAMPGRERVSVVMRVDGNTCRIYGEARSRSDIAGRRRPDGRRTGRRYALRRGLVPVRATFGTAS